MSAETEIVRILRSGERLSGRDIHERGSFHDLQGTLAKLQEMSQASGPVAREKPENSGVFVYWLKSGATAMPVDDDEAPPRSPVVPEKQTAPIVAQTPPKPSTVNGHRSGAKLHEHLFKALEDLEAGKIDHVQANARANIADKIIKLASVQLLFEQLKQQQAIPNEITSMPLNGEP